MAGWPCDHSGRDARIHISFRRSSWTIPSRRPDFPVILSPKLRSNHVALTREEVEEKVINIVCGQLGTSREKVKPETSFINDLGADSLDTVELVMEFEDEFDISIPDEDAEKIQSVGNAIDYIFNKQ